MTRYVNFQWSIDCSETLTLLHFINLFAPLARFFYSIFMIGNLFFIPFNTKVSFQELIDESRHIQWAALGIAAWIVFLVKKNPEDIKDGNVRLSSSCQYSKVLMTSFNLNTFSIFHSLPILPILFVPLSLSHSSSRKTNCFNLHRSLSESLATKRTSKCFWGAFWTEPE